MLNKIDKTAHFVWGSSSGLPLSRYLSLSSFVRHNPGYNAYLHVFDCTFSPNSASVKFRGREYTNTALSYVDFMALVDEIPRLHIEHHKCNRHGLEASYPPTFMSDVLRYFILAERGGFFFDTDIIFLDSLENSYLKSPLFDDIGILLNASTLCMQDDFLIRIGVLGSSSCSKFFLHAYKLAQRRLNLTEYQSCGSLVLEELLKVHERQGLYLYDHLTLGDHIHSICDSLFYLYSSELMRDSSLTHSQYSELVSNSPYFNGVHWYGGGNAAAIDSIADIDTVLHSEGPASFAVHLFRQCLLDLPGALDCNRIAEYLVSNSRTALRLVL